MLCCDCLPVVIFFLSIIIVIYFLFLITVKKDKKHIKKKKKAKKHNGFDRIFQYMGLMDVVKMNIIDFSATG